MASTIKKIVMENLDYVDKQVSYKAFSCSQKFAPKLKPFLVGLEWSCNGLIWLSGTIILLLASSSDSNAASIYAQLLVGLIVDVFYIAITKSLARRRRPTYAYQRDQIIVASVDKHSMPSGHCSRATYLALFATHFYGPSTPVLALAVQLWTLCVCVSRVLLGRHHILDCLAGNLLGYLEYQIQFNSFLPVNSIGLFLVAKLFGNKSAFSTRNDLDGIDPLD